MTKILKPLALVFSVSLCSTAGAYTIDSGSVNVGSLDNLLGSTTLPNQGRNTETNWVNSVLGGTSSNLSQEYKNERSKDVQNWTAVDGESSLSALELDEAVDYFVLKLGVPRRSGADDTYLFENSSALNWAVIDFDGLFSGSQLDFNFGRISYISGYNGPDGPGNGSEEPGNGPIDVPEPGPLALMGLGLLAFAVRRYRKA